MSENPVAVVLGLVGALLFRNVFVYLDGGFILGIVKDFSAVFTGLAIIVLAPSAKALGESIKRKLFTHRKKQQP